MYGSKEEKEGRAKEKKGGKEKEEIVLYVFLHKGIPRMKRGIFLMDAKFDFPRFYFSSAPLYS